MGAPPPPPPQSRDKDQVMPFPPIRRWIEDRERGQIAVVFCIGYLYVFTKRGKNSKVLKLFKMAKSMLVSFSLIFYHCFLNLLLNFATTFSYTMRQSKNSSLLYNTTLHTLSLRFIAEYTYIYLHINTLDTTGGGGEGDGYLVPVFFSKLCRST
jgi:hypothetical protein